MKDFRSIIDVHGAEHAMTVGDLSKQKEYL